MLNTPIKAAFLWLLAAGAGFAQNSDLAVLVGVSGPNSEVVGGTNPHVSSNSGSASVQFNYAFQVRNTPGSYVYVELPLFITGSSFEDVSRTIVSAHRRVVFLTPGVWFSLFLHNRISVYGALGGGVGWVDNKEEIVGPGMVSSINGWSAGPALDFGGGLDFRLTRLLSLRGEARDFVTRTGYGTSTGHNSLFFTFGIGFHF